MKVFWFAYALFVIEGIAVLAESLENRELNAFTRTKRLLTTNNNTCPVQKLLMQSPKGAILKSRGRENNVTFHSGEKAEFVCKDGYRQIGELQSLICQENGKWKEYSKHRTGLCVSCAPTLVDVTGKATGLLKSNSKNNQKTNSEATLCSSWKLQTDDKGFYIKLLFKTFSMSPDCKNNNFVSLENANFTDTLRTAKCCEPSSDRGVCKFGGINSPPLSRTATNWMTVMFFSGNNESTFTAVWYNVNNLYPGGAIPSEDSTHASRIKLPTKKRYAPQSPAAPILAFVLFALLLLSLGCFISCKLGERYLGPSCSFRYFLAWALRRAIPPETSPPHSEDRNLTAVMDISFSGEESARGTPGGLQATYLGDDSDDSSDSRDGSTESMI